MELPGRCGDWLDTATVTAQGLTLPTTRRTRDADLHMATTADLFTARDNPARSAPATRGLRRPDNRAETHHGGRQTRSRRREPNVQRNTLPTQIIRDRQSGGTDPPRPAQTLHALHRPHGVCASREPRGLR